MKKNPFYSFFPLLFFVTTYFSTSLYYKDFYKVPMLVLFIAALFIALFQYRKVPIADKINAFTKGAGDENILLMILIFLLSGAFGQISKEIGALQTTIDLAIHFLSPQLIVTGLFLLSCLISLSLGTSVGTIAALAPIAVGLNEQLHLEIGLVLAAIVGGSMFGDNLSFISDTTIAATSTQGISMRSKFNINFKIVFPAAILTAVIYYFITPSNITISPTTLSTMEIIKTIPYLTVLVLALLGMNVLWTLLIGIILAIPIGIVFRTIGFTDSLLAIQSGFSTMFELSIICIIIGGIIGIIRSNGGIDYILNHSSTKLNTPKKAEFGIAFLTGLVNSALANNTLAIILVGPIAKEIAIKNKVDLARSASILDTTSCFIQGILPYGAQLLTAIAISKQTTSPITIISYLYYPFLTGIATVLFILLSKHKYPIKTIG